MVDIIKLKEHIKKFSIMYHDTKVSIPYPKNPRSGQCVSCQRVRGVEIKVTQLHHTFYEFMLDTVRKNPLLALKNTLELCFPCIEENTYMLVNAIPIQVKQMGITENILNQIGENQKIIQSFVRDYDGDLIWIKGRGLLPFGVTPEHPIKITRRKVIIKYPTINGKSTTKRGYVFSTSDWVEAQYINKLPSNGKILDNQPYLVFPKYKVERENTIINELNLRLTNSLGELFGLYLAEGYSNISRRKKSGIVGTVYWSFGKHETQLIERTKSLIKEIFGKDAGIINKRTSTVVYICSVSLARFLHNKFGSSANNKVIPTFIMESPKDIAKSFINGYFKGDGYLNGNYKDFCTSSIYIVIQLQKLLSKLNIFAPVFHSKKGSKQIYIENRLVTRHDEYHIYINENTHMRNYGENENNFYIPIKKTWRNHYKGKVYNFETEDNTYQISNIVVHNCHQIADGFRNVLDGTSMRYVMDVVVLLPVHQQTYFARICKEFLKWYEKPPSD